MTQRRSFLTRQLLASAMLVFAGCIPTTAPTTRAHDEPAAVSPTPSTPAPLLDLTPAAVNSVQEIISKGQANGSLPKEVLCLRVRVIAGGCTGFSHKLDLDPEVGPEDYTFLVAGVNAVVYLRQKEMLRGSVIDHVQSVKQTGFSVKNPNFEGEAAKRWLSILAAQPKEKEPF